MEGAEQQERYREACRLYEQGQFKEARVIFDALARERPKSKHLVFSRAMCLLALGEIDHARSLCNRLGEMKSQTAQKLRLKLSAEIKDREMLDRKKAEAQRPPSDRREAHERRKSDDRRASGDRRQRDVSFKGHDRRQILDRRQGEDRRDTVDRRHPNRPASYLETHLTDESDDFFEGKKRTLWKPLLAAAVILAVATAGLLALRQYSIRLPKEPSLDLSAFPMGDGPDRYIEVVRFFPARDRKSFEIIMFLAPYKNDSKNGGGDLSECVGSKATGNWEDIKSLIGKAFAMSRHRTGILAGVPQDNMVRTIVLPRDAMDVHRGLKADRVETCLAGSVQSVAGLAAECGEYNHVESWTNRAQLAGINGNVYWWGRIGVAEGGNGAISHVLVRSYPSEKH